MNKPTQSTEGKPTKPDAGDQPRPVRVAALLNAAATLGAAVLVVAMSDPKVPPYFCE